MELTVKFDGSMEQVAKDCASVSSDVNTLKKDVQTLGTYKDKLDGLSDFGGRNLYLNSNNIKSTIRKYDGGNLNLSNDEIVEFGKKNCLRIKADAGNFNDTTKAIIDPEFSEIVDGEKYTFSFYVKNNREYDMYMKIKFLSRDDIIKIEANTSKRVVITDKFVSNSISIYLNSFSNKYYLDCTIGYFKLETGSIVTDWTPAPEDFISSDIVKNIAVIQSGTSTDNIAPGTLIFEV